MVGSRGLRPNMGTPSLLRQALDRPNPLSEGEGTSERLCLKILPAGRGAGMLVSFGRTIGD